MLEAVGYFREAQSDDRLFIAWVLSSLVRCVNFNSHPLHDSSCESQEVLVAAALYPVVASGKASYSKFKISLRLIPLIDIKLEIEPDISSLQPLLWSKPYPSIF